MALNNFTLKEAIEICISLRDRIIRENAEKGLCLYEMYREPDALAKLINIAEKEQQKCEGKKE